MTDRGMFVLFDFGETLVDLTDLVGRIADRLRREIPGMEQDAEKTSHDWIRRTSASLPREETRSREVFRRDHHVGGGSRLQAESANLSGSARSPRSRAPRQRLRLRHTARPAGSRGGRHEDGATSEGTPLRIREASTGCAATFEPPGPARHLGELVEGTPRSPVTWP